MNTSLPVNRSLLASVALVALAASSVLASSAFAADMPVKAPVKMPVAVSDWTGFYVGGNIGWSFGRERTDWTIGSAAAGSASGKMDGILGGLQFGYNWQTANWVVGLEADIQATGQKGSSSLTNSITTSTTTTILTNPCLPVASCPTPVTTTTTTISNAALVSDVKLPWLGTIRGRLGMTLSPTWLIYATGGAAYGMIQATETLFTAGVSGAAGTSTLHSGWTVGGGIETALANNWTAKLEYLYVDLGTVGIAFTGIAPFTPIAPNIHVTDNIVRFGMNYRFGPAAVVAKY